MDRATFDKFRKLIYKRAGIQLADSKITLVRARIGKRISHLGLKNEKEYFEFVVNDKTNKELIQLLNVISTNVTNFFRESSHFDFLEPVFSRRLEDGQRKFRFWSAGCSSGQEPLTLAMVLLNTLQKMHIPESSVDIKILATDISTKVLNIALKGEYDEGKIEGIPKMLLNNWFDRKDIQGKKVYKAKDSIKKLIVYKRLNLSKPPFPMRGPMDVIFCRNTMIYFDNTVRSELVGEFRNLVRPDGYLMIGHSESLNGFSYDFEARNPSIYQRNVGKMKKAV